LFPWFFLTFFGVIRRFLKTLFSVYIVSFCLMPPWGLSFFPFFFLILFYFLFFFNGSLSFSHPWFFWIDNSPTALPVPRTFL